MAVFRKINTTFWSDPFICDLSPERKLFYLYILTNERTKQCGIYDISKRQISFDLGIDVKKVKDNIDFFTKAGKIMYSESTNEIAIKNWNRFNGSNSPKVISCIESELKLVKNRVLIEYIYSMHTASQEEEEQEEEKEQEEEQEEEKEEVVGFDETTPPVEKIDFNKFLLFFNENRGLMPSIEKMTPARKNRIKLLIKQYGKESIEIAIKKTRDSAFLQGDNPRNWIATFDWMFKQENFVKILESNYDTRAKIDNSEQLNRQHKQSAVSAVAALYGR